MSAFVRLQSDATWLAGYTPVRADFEDWDRKIAASINAVDGGTYAPSTPLVFQDGVDPVTGDGTQLRITGPLKVCYGARFTAASGAHFIVPGAQFEQLPPGHIGGTRTILTPMAGAIVTPSLLGTRLPFANAVQVFAPQVTVDIAPAPADLVNDLWSFGPYVSKTTRVTQILRTHNGAVLTTVTLRYRLGSGSTARARLLRCDSSGGSTPITLAAGDTDGWTKLATTNAAVDIQTAEIVCDAALVVDKSHYSYALQIEEVPTASNVPLLLKRSARLVATTNVSAMTGTPVIDGVQTVAGDVVLLVGQTNAKENGLWIIVSGAAFFPVGITIAVLGDFIAYTSEGFFPAGYVVPVTDGVTLAGTLWQCTNKADYAVAATAVHTTTSGSSTTSTLVTGKLLNLGAPAGTNPALEVAQRFVQLAAVGGTYVSAIAHHVGITDTRWQ